MFRAEVVKDMPLHARRFEFEPEFTAKVLKRGHRIFEVPISYYGREYRRGKKDHLARRAHGILDADQVPVRGLTSNLPQVRDLGGYCSTSIQGRNDGIHSGAGPARTARRGMAQAARETRSGDHFQGQPIALLIDVEGDLEEVLAAVRRARAQLAVSRMRQTAQTLGLERLATEEVEAEIQAIRREHSA